MKPVVLLPCLALGGLLAGFAAHRMLGAETPAAPPPAASVTERTGTPPATGSHARSFRPPSAAGRAVSIHAAGIRSEDSLETLQALPDDELFARLAVWMIDASSEDIGAFWEHYRGREQRRNDINDLIFVNWTRVDPRGAIAAATGTPDEHYAWWAWTCHEPEAALAAVQLENPARLNNVTWGLGEFHPEWLMENFARIPEEGRQNALHGLAKWDDVADPVKMLKFFEEHEYGYQPRIFKVLVRKDPWAAYDWIQERGATALSSHGGQYDLMTPFLEVVGDQHPEVLDRLIAESPPGAERRQLEALAFEQQLKSDPEGAIARALAEEAPRIAEQQLALAGAQLLASDPDRAFELAARLLEVNPQTTRGSWAVFHSNGYSSSGRSPEVSRLMDGLMMTDPARTMELAFRQGGDEAPQDLANGWAQRDLAGYAEWAATLRDPAELSLAARPIVDELIQEGRFEEASQWTLAIEPNERTSGLYQLINRWKYQDPEATRRWIEQAPLSETERRGMQQFLPQIHE